VVARPPNAFVQYLVQISLGPTLFRGPWNFEPSHGICPFPPNFRISAEFRGISAEVLNVRQIMMNDESCRQRVDIIGGHSLSSDLAGCFAVLRQLRSIRRFVPSSVYQSLVVVLVLSRLDYGNATLAEPASLTVFSHQRGSSVDRRYPSLGTYRCSRQFPLASRARAHQVQTGGPCVPSNSGHCTSVPIGPASRY